MKVRNWFVMLSALIIISGAALYAIRPPGNSTLYAAEPSPQIIAVNGEAILTVKPDTEVITVGVTTESKTAQEAMAQNSAKMNALLDALLAAGVKENEMQTIRYAVHPRYDYSNQTQRLTGFTVANSLRLTLSADANVGQLLDKASQAGANTIDSVSYQVRDMQQHRDQALEQAMADARHRAEVLAKSAGVTIKGVKSVIESSGSAPIPLDSNVRYESMKQMASLADTPVLSGETQIRFYVAVEYLF